MTDAHRVDPESSIRKGPIVSAILPTFNAASFMDRAIRSVLSQHSPALLELIIVDDCSVDGTADFVRRQYGADERVKLLSTDRNRGPGAARNVAIGAASGEWIALIDADDAWTPDRLERLLPLCTSGIDLVFDNLIAYDQQAGAETEIMFPVMPESMSIADMAAERAPATVFNYGYLKPLLRRGFLEQSGVTYGDTRISEDLLMYLELLTHGAKSATTSQAGYIYTTPIGQLSGKRSAISASVPDDLLIARLLQEFVLRYEDRLSASDIAAISARSATLRQYASLTRLYESWTRSQYLSFAWQCVSDPDARRALVAKIAERISARRRRSPGAVAMSDSREW